MASEVADKDAAVGRLIMRERVKGSSNESWVDESFQADNLVSLRNKIARFCTDGRQPSDPKHLPPRDCLVLYQDDESMPAYWVQADYRDRTMHGDQEFLPPSWVHPITREPVDPSRVITWRELPEVGTEPAPGELRVIREALIDGLSGFQDAEFLAKVETAWMAGRAESLLRDYANLLDAMARAGIGRELPEVE